MSIGADNLSDRMEGRHERKGTTRTGMHALNKTNRFRSRMRHRCIPIFFVPRSSGRVAGTVADRRESTGELASTLFASQRSRCISGSFCFRPRRFRPRELHRLATGLSAARPGPASPCDPCAPPAARSRDSLRCNTGVYSLLIPILQEYAPPPSVHASGYFR